MHSIEIRDAEEQDLPGVLKVLAESGIDGGHSFTLEQAREHYARIRQWPNFRLLAAIVDGEVGGTYSLLVMDKLGKRCTPGGVQGDCAGVPARPGGGMRR